MTIRRQVASVAVLRPATLRALRMLGDRDITVKHPWTGDRLSVHMFRHRAYWFHGRSREAVQMRLAAVLARDSHTILDVGAHIGYLSVYYRHLAPKAQIIAIEPSPANLKYLRRNAVSAGIDVVPCAVGDATGEAPLFEESLSGQNSSLIADFDVLERNARGAAFSTPSHEVSVAISTLDHIREEYPGVVGFLKIDVEGFELEALRGAQRLLAADCPSLQVEVQRNGERVVGMLEDAGYLLFGARPREHVVHTSYPTLLFGVHTGRDVGAFAEAAAPEGYRPL